MSLLLIFLFFLCCVLCFVCLLSVSCWRCLWIINSWFSLRLQQIVCEFRCIISEINSTNWQISSNELSLHYGKKVLKMMINNFTNINKTNQSPLTSTHKKDHNIWSLEQKCSGGVQKVNGMPTLLFNKWNSNSNTYKSK